MANTAIFWNDFISINYELVTNQIEYVNIVTILNNKEKMFILNHFGHVTVINTLAENVSFGFYLPKL